MLRKPALSQKLQMNLVAAMAIERMRAGSQEFAFLLRV